jgi:hypothetical protein
LISNHENTFLNSFSRYQRLHVSLSLVVPIWNHKIVSY